MKKVALHNLGCKVNSYETDAMRQSLEQNGYQIVPFAEGADIYIINTCTVTNIADRKSRQMLHKAKKLNPDAIVVAAGCYVQVAKEKAQKDECIDIIIGNNKKKDLIQVLKEYERSASAQAYIDIAQDNEYETLNISKTGEHTRAYIKVQDGCNQFCSYCIIPYARGRVRSRSQRDIVEEIERLVLNGYQEVVLTGIHVSSYGTDFSEIKENLLTLLQTIHKIVGLKRIRLGSLEPTIMTEAFIKELSKLEKLCPHFHLSLQSGSDETLKRMNRRYRTDEYLEKCCLLRKYFVNPAITTDVIVGFPGETQEEFLQTRDFLKKVQFYETHIFKYSRREGTRAAAMDHQVDDRIKAERSSELIHLSEKNAHKYREQYIGKEIEVLMEEHIQIENETYQIGYTKEYIKAAIRQKDSISNYFITGKAERFLTKDILLLKLD